jgi:contractile injection system tube protein
MSTFPNSPRLQKGALVGLDPVNPLASVIVFQYNPEKLTRTVAPQSASAHAGGATAPGEALRLLGPPDETIKLEVDIDATDQLEKAQPPTTAAGIHPQLAALEMLLYPKSALVIANEVLLRAGVIEVVPPETPLAVLVWGAKRVLPVRLTSLNITEEMFDPNLNPIHAKATLDLRVLNYRDLGLLSPGGGLFMAHQLVKEGLATLNGAANAGAILSSI